MKKNSQLIQLLQTNPGMMTILKAGDLVEATFLQKAVKAAYFDLGQQGTGIIYGIELMNANNIIKNLKPGDKVSAKVVDLENEDGYVELSLRAAGEQKAWQGVKELRDSGATLKVKITGVNSGGLMGDLNNLKAFMPVSQLSTDHYPRVNDGDKGKILDELKKFVGQELEVKIIDINPSSRKLIISEREITSENVKELISKYKVGDIVDGIISGVADFGAFMKFVDNPEVEGLIHISELGHRLIDNPKDVVKIDDPVKAKIIEIKDGRVSLSLKALMADPWVDVEQKFKAGDEVSGTISRFNPFGAFVSLTPDIQGLIHVSEFGGVEEMKKQIKEGASYTFKIDSVKPAEKRIILKLKK